MDQRRDDQMSTTDMAEAREASADGSEPRPGWLRPAEQTTATAVAEPADEPGDDRVGAVSVVEPEPELEEPVASHDDESPEQDRPQSEAPAERQVELMAVESRQQFRARWGDIQTGFVDDPAQAVRDADHLVADVMEHLATTSAAERGRLEERWSQGDEDTEHLRMALQRYRQLFGLLLEE